VAGTHGPVDVQATLPADVVDVRVPSGVSFDPATRILRYTVRRPKAGDARTVRARVADTAALGTVLETIGYVSAPDDVLPLDDRSVNRMVVVRRASQTRISASAAVARPWRGFCALR
jgi:hypothetical protein